MKAAVTVSLANRHKLRTAIDSLLAGTLTPPDGKLTWKNVAAVAGVSKATADRAIDLREAFRLELEELTPTPTERVPSQDRGRSDLDEELARLRKENAELKRATNVLHSVILALTHENEQLTRRSRRDPADVVALPGPGPIRSQSP